MIPPLITVDCARAHCRIDDEASDTDLYLKTLAVTQIVMNHIKQTTVPEEWLSDTISSELNLPAEFVPSIIVDSSTSPVTTSYVNVPGNVFAAMLLVLSELFENRESSVSDPLSDTVLNLLEGYRTPTIA